MQFEMTPQGEKVVFTKFDKFVHKIQLSLIFVSVIELCHTIHCTCKIVLHKHLKWRSECTLFLVR